MEVFSLSSEIRFNRITARSRSCYRSMLRPVTGLDDLLSEAYKTWDAASNLWTKHNPRLPRNIPGLMTPLLSVFIVRKVVFIRNDLSVPPDKSHEG